MAGKIEYIAENVTVAKFMALQGDYKLEKLQMHPVQEIYEMSYRLIDGFIPSNHVMSTSNDNN